MLEVKRIAHMKDVQYNKIQEEQYMYNKKYDTLYFCIYHNGKFDVSGEVIHYIIEKYGEKGYNLISNITDDNIKNRLKGTLFTTTLYFTNEIKKGEK